MLPMQTYAASLHSHEKIQAKGLTNFLDQDCPDQSFQKPHSFTKE